MKVVLIFSPFVAPTYIPLGISQLKSYIAQHLPYVELRNIDLNNIFFNKLAKKEFWDSYKNLCSFCSRKNECADHSLKSCGEYCREEYLNSVDLLRDEKSVMNHNISRYNFLMQHIAQHFFSWNKCLGVALSEILKNDCSIPKYLEDLFSEDVNRIINENPDAVGFSIFSATQLAYSLIIACILKKKVDLPIVFGGAAMHHVDAAELLDVFKWVDFIIIKEGEKGLVKFIDNFKDKDYDLVPGLIFRKDDKVISNKEEAVDNLEDLPFPDFSDFDLSQYFFKTPVLPIIFSRGCFWKKCSFCSYHKNYSQRYKMKSIDRFIEELKHFAGLGIKYFMIDDDIISAKHLNLISQAIFKEGLSVFFGAITRPYKDFSLEIFKNIYRAGGRLFVWGVESINQRVLDLMNKGTDAQDIKLILKNSAKVGFWNHCFMIVGFPTQTAKEIGNDLRFLLESEECASYGMHGFYLKKGSYIFSHPDEFGINNFKENSIYARKDKSFNDDTIFFESETKLDWKKIDAACLALDKWSSQNRLSTLDHAHALILASQNG